MKNYIEKIFNESQDFWNGWLAGISFLTIALLIIHALFQYL